jgi:hypothetical protein
MAPRKAPGLRLQTSIVQDNVPVEVAAGLFVGSIHAAFNVDALKSNKISHVLNLAGSYATFPEDFTYLSLSIRDKEYASLLSCLPVAAVFIDAGLKSGGVLVHCAGGRSRSPAVAMAFLMMKQQMPYSAIAAHVKTLRPVVSLNVGFDAQLKCLETARGDVFEANQHLLKARLARLAQQHADGELVSEVARKRRQSRQASGQSPPPLLKKQSSIELLASGCDERGMVGERVPSGFCLSLPSEKSLFIPALRSMGTMFGCQSCGESLFCAGSIVHHHGLAKLTPQEEEAAASSGETRFLGALRGRPVETVDEAARVPVGEERVVAAAGEGSTKKPLLAKLRLRPHSPSGTMGTSSRTASCSDVPASRQQSESTAVAKPSMDTARVQTSEDEAVTGLPPTLQVLLPTRRPATEQSKRTSSSTLSPTKLSGDPKKKAGSALWRSLTSFKSSKRATKAAVDDKKLQTRAKLSDLHKPGGSSCTANATAVGDMPAHVVFLKRNAADWCRSFQQLEGVSKNAPLKTSALSTGDQLAALLDEDSTVLVASNGCSQWFVDPQLWTVDQATARPEGELRCPKVACGAVVGEWRWEGLRYAGCVNGVGLKPHTNSTACALVQIRVRRQHRPRLRNKEGRRVCSGQHDVPIDGADGSCWQRDSP